MGKAGDTDDMLGPNEQMLMDVTLPTSIHWVFMIPLPCR